MKISPIRSYGLPPIRKIVSSIERKLQALNPATRALIRQNAIRRAIASLVEIERMRLALTIAHRNDA
jgi:hypothetical protein